MEEQNNEVGTPAQENQSNVPSSPVETPAAVSSSPSEAETTVAPAAAKVVVSQEDRVWGLLSYVPLLSLAVLVLRSKSSFCRFHGTQGLALSGLVFLMMVVSTIVTVVSPAIGILILFLVMALSVYVAAKAYAGDKFSIPIISEIAKIIPVESLIAGVVGAENASIDPVANESIKVEIPVEAPSIVEQPKGEKPLDSSGSTGTSEE